MEEIKFENNVKELIYDFDSQIAISIYEENL